LKFQNRGLGLIYSDLVSLARQFCPAVLPSSLARQSCKAVLPGNLARQSCPAVVPGSLPSSLARQSRPAVLTGSLTRQSYPAVLPGSLAQQNRTCKVQTGKKSSRTRKLLAGPKTWKSPCMGLECLDRTSTGLDSTKQDRHTQNAKKTTGARGYKVQSLIGGLLACCNHQCTDSMPRHMI
jgi:hypothetical protein